MPRLMASARRRGAPDSLSALQKRTAGPSVENRWVSAADFRAFCQLKQLEARVRENVWQSGARNRVPKNG
jgi:hypothetical protein